MDIITLWSVLAYLNSAALADSRPAGPELKVGDVQPFGATGIGLLTGHPVGLVTIGGISLLAIELVPPVRVFFLASVFFGSLIGLVLWLLHR